MQVLIITVEKVYAVLQCLNCLFSSWPRQYSSTGFINMCIKVVSPTCYDAERNWVFAKRVAAVYCNTIV